MKSFIKSGIIFSLPIFILLAVGYIGLKKILTDAYGPTTYQQISKQFNDVTAKEYETIILGNSKMYRGLDPDGFTLPTYNFAHDSESFNQEYYKLEYLLENNVKFKYMILGMDYFHFSELKNKRNYAYVDYFPEAYLADYKDTGNLSEFFNVINPKTFSKLRYDTTYKCTLRDNGFYIKDRTQIHYDEKYFMKDSAALLPVQQKYFEKIIALCKEKGIKVFIVFPPTLDISLVGYDDNARSTFKNYLNKVLAANPQVTYMDYAKHPSFDESDSTDNMHLYAKSALKFAKILDKDIMKEIGQ